MCALLKQWKKRKQAALWLSMLRLVESCALRITSSFSRRMLQKRSRSSTPEAYSNMKSDFISRMFHSIRILVLVNILILDFFKLFAAFAICFVVNFSSFVVMGPVINGQDFSCFSSSVFFSLACYRFLCIFRHV